MSDLHIDDFYKDSARIFAQLYSAFPRTVTLYVEDFSGTDTPDEFGLHSVRHQACFATILWLAQSGYLAYNDTVRQEAVDQANLTHKAFTLLTARAIHSVEDTDAGGDSPELPAAVAEANSTNIAHIRLALQEGSSIRINRVMQQLFLQARHFS